MRKKHAKCRTCNSTCNFFHSLLIAHTGIYLFCIDNLTSDQSLSPEFICTQNRRARVVHKFCMLIIQLASLEDYPDHKLDTMSALNEYRMLLAENSSARKYESMKKIGSALFYGFASFFITVVNKTVLTSWSFPSFWVLSVGQIAVAIIVLYTARRIGVISFPNYSNEIPRKIFPLPLVHFGNMMFGLGATQALPLPMFTAIRRVSILITMLLECRILGVRPSFAVKLSVWSMIVGALIAAWDDLSFTLHGYTYVMIVNVMTAANGVYLKQKLDAADIGKYGIMFYNSLLMFLPALFGAWLINDIDAAYNYAHWTEPAFVLQFFLSCIMGFVLMYSNLLCTQYNSALTTSIIGCLKNVLVSYLGMFIGGDYIFSWWNCVGINISIIGSIFYTYVIFGTGNDSRTTKNNSAENNTIRI